MRISDWSSDVCSSDLPARSAGGDGARPHHRADGAARALRRPGAAARLDDAAQPGRTLVSAWRRCNARRAGGGAERSWQPLVPRRSEEHTSELQSLMRISYAVFCLKKKKKTQKK